MLMKLGLEIVDEDGCFVVDILVEDFKDFGNRDFKVGCFVVVVDHYSEVLLVCAFQRLCFAMTCHTCFGSEWAGSAAKLSYAAGFAGEFDWERLFGFGILTS